jgi:hypothetical protein
VSFSSLSALLFVPPEYVQAEGSMHRLCSSAIIKALKFLLNTQALFNVLKAVAKAAKKLALSKKILYSLPFLGTKYTVYHVSIFGGFKVTTFEIMTRRSGKYVNVP